VRWRNHSKISMQCCITWIRPAGMMLGLLSERTAVAWKQIAMRLDCP
jgi:hypothetical protein